MKREMHHVVRHITGVEAGADHPGQRCAEDEDEDAEERCRERNRERGRQHEALRVVWVVVMHAVDHPVDARSDPVLRLKVEHRPVEPVFDERPEGVAAGDRCHGRASRQAAQPEHCEQHDRRAEDQNRNGRMDAREPIEQARREHRR